MRRRSRRATKKPGSGVSPGLVGAALVNTLFWKILVTRVNRKCVAGRIIRRAGIAPDPARRSIQPARFFGQHDRDAVADRIGELGRARDQLLFLRIVFERTLGQRADQNFQELRINAAGGPLGRGSHGATPNSMWLAAQAWLRSRSRVKPLGRGTRAVSYSTRTRVASVPIPKFASLCRSFVCELRNRRTLATY